MTIRDAAFIDGSSAFWFDDQRAVKAGAGHDGFAYAGKPLTPGFVRVRQPGKAVLVALVLSDDRVVFGDCAAVQYSGAGGRDPLLDPARYIPFLERQVKPWLIGRRLDSFRELATDLDALRFPDPAADAVGEPVRLHTALRYGLTQALLAARAAAANQIEAEVAADEWGLPLIASPVPIFGQSGDERYLNAEKMILKGVDALPHALINNIDEKLGRDGGKLRDYLAWLSRRIGELKTRDDYAPSLHVDVYGTAGRIFGDDPVRTADYLASLEAAAAPYPLYVEGPVDMEGKPAQIEALGRIKRRLAELGSPVKIVADEWCNTLEDIGEFAAAGCCHMIQIKTPDLGGLHDIVEAVLLCKRAGVEAYQGGTCNETDLSSRLCAHLAMASRPDRLLAKPGMGFDEGYSITANELARIGAVFALRRRHAVR
jgi:methylaspartate ammonia-lyase